MSSGRASDVAIVQRAAAHQARSILDDEHAKNALAREIATRRNGIAGALAALGKKRGEFVTDRAFRLLDAIARDAQVDAIAPENVPMFSRERELGRANVAQACSRLAEIEPRLASYFVGRGSDKQRKRADSSRDRGTRAPTSPVRTLVGPTAHSSDPLIRSQLALCVVYHYLAILDGKLPPEAAAEPYFSSRRKVVARSS